MAESVRGINVVIGMDTTKLGQALSDVESKSKSIQQELRQVERLLKFDPSNTTLLAQKQQLLAQQIENTSEKLNRLKSVQQQVNEQFQRGEISEGQYRAFQRELEKTEGQLRSLQSRLDETNSAIKQNTSTWGQLQEKLNAIGQRAQEVGQRMQAVGQELAMSFGAATLAIGGALGVATKKSMDFEAQLSSIKSVSGATGEQMEQLKNLAIEMGAKTKYSGLEAAQGIEELIKAGVSLEDIMKGGLEGALSLATAGELDLAEAAEIASTALNAFKADSLSVSDAANLLAGGANASATSVKELQYGLSQVSAVAAGLGLSFKDTTTALALFANNGLKGSDAGTSLKTMLSNLIPKSDAAAGMMKELGIITKDGANSFFDANGNIKSMADIAGILQNALKGLNAEQRQNALYTMFGSDAIRAANILYKEGADGIKKMYSEMSKVTAAQVAEEKMNNLKGRIEELKGAFETAQITIGSALTPAIEVLVKALQGLVDWFNNLSPATQSFVAIGAAVVAALTGIVAVVGIALTVIGSAIQGFGALSAALAGAGGAVSALSASFLPITGVILGVVGAAYLLYQAWQNNFGGLRDFTKQVWDAVVAKFNEVKAYVVPIIQELVSYISERWKSIEPIVTAVMNVVGAIVKFVLSFVLDTVKFYLNAVANIFKGVFDVISGIVKFFSALFTGDWTGMWEAIQQVLLGAVQAIWGLFNLWFVGKIAGVIGQFVSKGIGFIRGFIDDGIGLFTRFVSDVFGKVASWVSNMVQAISSGMSRFAEAIGATLRNIIKDFVDFVMFIPRQLSSLISQMVSIGKDIVQGIWNGIQQMGSWLANQITSWAKAMIPGPIAKALGIQSPSRVMRDEIGKWIPIGLAEGIEKNVNAVMSATNRMVNATMPNVNSIEVSVASAAVSQAPVVSTPTIIIENMAVRNDEDIYRISRELYSLSQSSRKARGMR